LEAVKQAKERRGGDAGERLPEQDEKALKFALQEKITTELAIRAHEHFLRFCAWLKRQEETGCIEEQLLWERGLSEVHRLVRSETEEALRAATDVQQGRLYV
jgi:hypothetical protein